MEGTCFQMEKQAMMQTLMSYTTIAYTTTLSAWIACTQPKAKAAKARFPLCNISRYSMCNQAIATAARNHIQFLGVSN